MKTKTFFILCLLLGMSMLQATAQKGPSDSHNVPLFSSYYGIWPIDCDGVQVDLLEGELSFHISQFCIPGPNGEDMVVWAIMKFRGTLTSTSGSGEVFKVQEVDKLNRPFSTSDTYIYHGIYKGNQGHSYDVWGHFDFSTGEFLIDKSICH
jgi:hypothetical protein